MLLERMVEPERVIMFRVVWLDDAGKHKLIADTVFR
jgi:glutamate dehydrogenase (NADP+)